jgi:hypothetical protein
MTLGPTKLLLLGSGFGGFAAFFGLSQNGAVNTQSVACHISPGEFGEVLNALGAQFPH